MGRTDVLRPRRCSSEALAVLADIRRQRASGARARDPDRTPAVELSIEAGDLRRPPLSRPVAGGSPAPAADVHEAEQVILRADVGVATADPLPVGGGLTCRDRIDRYAATDSQPLWALKRDVSNCLRASSPLAAQGRRAAPDELTATFRSAFLCGLATSGFPGDLHAGRRRDRRRGPSVLARLPRISRVGTTTGSSATSVIDAEGPAHGRIAGSGAQPALHVDGPPDQRLGGGWTPEDAARRLALGIVKSAGANRACSEASELHRSSSSLDIPLGPPSESLAAGDVSPVNP